MSILACPNLHRISWRQQLRYTDYLRTQGIPFMERVKPEPDALFTNNHRFKRTKLDMLSVSLDGRPPRNGEYKTYGRSDGHVSPSSCMMSRLHQQEICFPYIDHTVAYQRWLGDLQRLSISRMPEPVRNSLQEYLTLAQQHLDTARHHQIFFTSTGHFDGFEFAQCLMGIRSTNRRNR